MGTRGPEMRGDRHDKDDNSEGMMRAGGRTTRKQDLGAQYPTTRDNKGTTAPATVSNCSWGGKAGLVFKGSVYGTEKRPLTEPNWTDINRTSGYG